MEDELDALLSEAAEGLTRTSDGGFRTEIQLDRGVGNYFVWGTAIVVIMGMANIAYATQFENGFTLAPGDKLKFTIFRPLPICGGKIEFGLAICQVRQRTCYVTYEIRCGRNVYVHGEMNLLIQKDE